MDIFDELLAAISFPIVIGVFKAMSGSRVQIVEIEKVFDLKNVFFSIKCPWKFIQFCSGLFFERDQKAYQVGDARFLQ